MNSKLVLSQLLLNVVNNQTKSWLLYAHYIMQIWSSRMKPFGNYFNINYQLLLSVWDNDRGTRHS